MPPWYWSCCGVGIGGALASGSSVKEGAADDEADAETAAAQAAARRMERLILADGAKKCNLNSGSWSQKGKGERQTDSVGRRGENLSFACEKLL